MANIENLVRQHTDIMEMVSNIHKLMRESDLDKNASDIAKYISLLAGKLTIHLNTEDKFLYPELLKSSDEKMRKMAQEYIDEMGHIFQEYSHYKNEFNTRSKILNNEEGFISKTKVVFDMVEKRMDKEDRCLYPII